MTDDLKSRLRDLDDQPVCVEAADRIEQLEAERVLDEQRVADLMAQVADIAAERDELKATIYAATRHAAYLAIERCKNATGQRRQIELYVSANQCSEDACAAIDAAIAKGEKNA